MNKASLLALLLPAALGSCEKQSAAAEREAEIVERTGDRAATCEAKRKVAAAYLSEKNEDGYRLAHAAAESACLNHELRRRNGVAP